MALTDSTLDETLGERFAGTFASIFAERLFATTPHPLAELRALAHDGKPLPKFDLGITLRARTTMRTWPVISQNVAGVLRGSDRRLAREYVVLTAHMDHIGVGLPVNGDSIFNGTLDNASGVATLIEAAKKLARGPALRRSLVFVAVTGEEKGLLGSRYFANHPTVPAAAIVANANTDMLTAFYPLHSVIVNGLEESDLAADVKRAAAKRGLEAQTDPEPERNSFIRSDQYSFIKRGIPSVSLKFGFAPGSPEHEMVKRFRTERYHGLKDDLTQPIDLGAVADFNAFYVELVREIANRARRPGWNADSYFRVRN
jgi:Zn-dependent M28 family amino/carboxypeptidase